jgi:2-keto-3-deoxy-L-rhamnonate aldolase RhmA
MQSAINLKQKIHGDGLTIGIIITHHLWLELIEVAQFAGLDYVIIDAEHINHGDALIADACRIGRMTDFPVLIRPPRTDAESVRLAADLGPCGLLLPMIETAGQLDEVRDGLWMPPRGQRRPGGHANWWTPDFQYESMRRNLEDDFVILTQIESPLGVENARAIADHEVTTALAIGPYDLSARLGVCWQPEAPQLQDAVRKIKSAADAAAKPMWNIGDGQTMAAQGFTFLCIAEPMHLLRTTLKTMASSLRQGGHGSGQAVKAFVP